MLLDGGDLSGIWILLVGPAVLAVLAVIGLVIVVRTIERRRREGHSAQLLVALAVVLGLVAFGIGCCYVAVL